MVHSRSWHSRLFGVACLVTAGTLALAGCSSSDEEGPNDSGSGDSTNADSDTTDDASWPRTFENADGSTTEIPEQPQQIASTSVTVTGTLLAFDAPVAASGSAANGEYFAQWADEAADVENLWPAGTVDIEALYAAEPDLIVVAATGNDSVADQVDELNEIAPTIVVDYGGQTWQELAEQLGEATGMEDEAAASVEEFDSYVADAAAKIDVPDGEANIVSYNGPGENNPIARATSAQALLLTDLGFTVEDPPVEWHTQPEPRDDFVFAAYENLTELTADTSFILSQDNAGAEDGFAADEVLANLPSVQAEQVYGLGVNSFRVDMFSATEIVDDIVENFAK
ncbi:MAG: Fe2+-enterobactin ABC transporter substrate-binding protein [Cumulibacter sp.]